MTAESDEPEIAANGAATATAHAAASPRPSDVPAEIVEIFEFLSHNNQIVFKSQQIDDPELQRAEKVQIAREIFRRNRQTFLMRFGPHLEEQHLAAFARWAIDDAAVPLTPEEHCEEMQLLLHSYYNKLHTRKQDVKNRRYAAMQKLIEEGEYFSEQEMMKRAPELYQELVGRYLSEAEKKQRDEYDVRNTTFSGILMHTMEQQQLQDVLKQADRENTKCKRLLQASHKAANDSDYEGDDCDGDEISQSSSSNSSALKAGKSTASADDEVPVSFRQQWGNFDNEPVACSSSRPIRTKPQANQTLGMARSGRKCNAAGLITAGERDLLRQEFIGIMHEQFLSGNDMDFDYTQVDDNSQLDDLGQLNQDKEDAYFEESDEDGEVDIQDTVGEDTDASEDELDLYMSHLNQHHSLQINR